MTFKINKFRVVEFLNCKKQQSCQVLATSKQFTVKQELKISNNIQRLCCRCYKNKIDQEMFNFLEIKFLDI